MYSSTVYSKKCNEKQGCKIERSKILNGDKDCKILFPHNLKNCISPKEKSNAEKQKGNCLIEKRKQANTISDDDDDDDDDDDKIRTNKDLDALLNKRGNKLVEISQTYSDDTTEKEDKWEDEKENEREKEKEINDIAEKSFANKNEKEFLSRVNKEDYTKIQQTEQMPKRKENVGDIWHLNKEELEIINKKIAEVDYWDKEINNIRKKKKKAIKRKIKLHLELRKSNIESQKVKEIENLKNKKINEQFAVLARAQHILYTFEKNIYSNTNIREENINALLMSLKHFKEHIEYTYLERT